MTKYATPEQVENLRDEITEVLDKAAKKVTKLVKNGRDNGVTIEAFYEFNCELTTLDEKQDKGMTAVCSLTNDPSSIRTLALKMGLVLKALNQLVDEENEIKGSMDLAEFVSRMPVDLRRMAHLDKHLSHCQDVLKQLGMAKLIHDVIT